MAVAAVVEHRKVGQMRRKEFDPELHWKYDLAARWVLGAYLSEQGAKVIDDPFGPTGVDLRVIMPNGKWFYADVEVREGWEYGHFFFKTIHVPARKKKFASLPGEVYFISFRRDMKEAEVVPGNMLRDEYLREQPNKYIREDEYFYAVPIKHTRRIILN